MHFGVEFHKIGNGFELSTIELCQVQVVAEIDKFLIFGLSLPKKAFWVRIS